MIVFDEDLGRYVAKADLVGDKHHSMAELYQHRYALWLNLLVLIDSDEITWKAKVHDDGTMFEGSFLSAIELPTGRVSYHLPLEYWDWCVGRELEKAPPHDGHTSDDVLSRLFAMIGFERPASKEAP